MHCHAYGNSARYAAGYARLDLVVFDTRRVMNDSVLGGVRRTAGYARLGLAVSDVLSRTSVDGV
jgi:hypothetical protein